MEKNRDQIIIRTSITGIIANVFLAAFKAFVGMASHSVAVVMDAVNNLSDALSSLITIIGTKLAGKASILGGAILIAIGLEIFIKNL